MALKPPPRVLPGQGSCPLGPGPGQAPRPGFLLPGGRGRAMASRSACPPVGVVKPPKGGGFLPGGPPQEQGQSPAGQGQVRPVPGPAAPPWRTLPQQAEVPLIHRLRLAEQIFSRPVLRAAHRQHPARSLAVAQHRAVGRPQQRLHQGVGKPRLLPPAGLGGEVPAVGGHLVRGAVQPPVAALQGPALPQPLEDLSQALLGGAHPAAVHRHPGGAVQQALLGKVGGESFPRPWPPAGPPPGGTGNTCPGTGPAP